MTFSYKYKNNPAFPYTKVDNLKNYHKKEDSQEISFFSDISFLSSFLSPIENFIGRKIEFDDILLVIIIYLIFTEKNKENNTLLLCLLFILFN